MIRVEEIDTTSSKPGNVQNPLIHMLLEVKTAREVNYYGPKIGKKVPFNWHLAALAQIYHKIRIYLRTNVI